MPVKYIGSTAPEMTLYGVSHWPRRHDPQPPLMPTALLREAMLVPPPSTFTADSTWKNAERRGEMTSVPRKPRFDEFDVTRLRRATFTPVGDAPSAPAGSAPDAVASRASTLSRSTLRVP